MLRSHAKKKKRRKEKKLKKKTTDERSKGTYIAPVPDSDPIDTSLFSVRKVLVRRAARQKGTRDKPQSHVPLGKCSTRLQRRWRSKALGM